MDLSNTDISNLNIPDDLKTQIQNATENEEKVRIVNTYRRNKIIDMVVRQTSLSREDAEYFLTKTGGNMIIAIRLAMNGETRETLTPDKIKQAYAVRSNRVIQPSSTVNQQIYHTIRTFMDKPLY